MYCKWSHGESHILVKKLPESSDPMYDAITKWLRQKGVLMVLVETIPDTLSLGKEIQIMIR